MATKKLSKKSSSSSKAKLSTELPRKIKAKTAAVKGTPERASSAKPSKVTRVTPPMVKKKGATAKDDASGSISIDVGESAPSFVLQDHTGTMISSESLRGSSYILYFYPKDDTPGCTLEACGFRDSAPRFTAKGVKVLGVSPDSPEAHARFRKKYDLSFPLLSDPEKTLAKAYGVWVKKQNYGREYMGVERSTFFVDRHGVVKKVWRKVRVPGHVDEVLHSV